MISYATMVEGSWKDSSKRDLVLLRQKTPLWSARLSTGLFGRTDCSSGNRGPKGRGEVILASGTAGLRSLITYGFIPCPTCKPENTEGFWESVADVVADIYGIDSLARFASKDVLPFDARRVQYRTILAHTNTAPGCIYVPRDLRAKDVRSFRDEKGFPDTTPAIGYYAADAPGRFFEYK